MKDIRIRLFCHSPQLICLVFTYTSFPIFCQPFYTGKEIEVQFDQPTALQIDGETVLGVESYRVKA